MRYIISYIILLVTISCFLLFCYCYCLLDCFCILCHHQRDSPSPFSLLTKHLQNKHCVGNQTKKKKKLTLFIRKIFTVRKFIPICSHCSFQRTFFFSLLSATHQCTMCIYTRATFDVTVLAVYNVFKWILLVGAVQSLFLFLYEVFFYCSLVAHC